MGSKVRFVDVDFIKLEPETEEEMKEWLMKHGYLFDKVEAAKVFDSISFAIEDEALYKEFMSKFLPEILDDLIEIQDLGWGSQGDTGGAYIPRTK